MAWNVHTYFPLFDPSSHDAIKFEIDKSQIDLQDCSANLSFESLRDLLEDIF